MVGAVDRRSGQLAHCGHGQGSIVIGEDVRVGGEFPNFLGWDGYLQ